MQLIFVPLCFLDADELSILEIKRIDFEAAPEKHLIHYWLIHDKQSGLINRLTFSAMDSTSDLEERFFEEGFLKFNTQTGTYITKFNANQYELRVKPTSSLPITLEQQISCFLNATDNKNKENNPAIESVPQSPLNSKP